MSEPKQPPKIVHLFTGTPYEPPQPVRTDVDERSQEMLNEIGELVESGELVGICLFGYNTRTKRMEIFTQLPPGQENELSALQYLGATDLLKSCLLDIAEFGFDAVMETNMEEGPDDGDDAS